METIEGTVTNLRFSTKVTGSKEGTETEHIALFELDGKPVELKLSESIFISNEDRILVAGQPKRGLFRGMAYFNKTHGVKGKQSTLHYFIVGAVFCATVLLSPVGIWALVRGFKYQEAFRMVDI
jgi:hypothetical protein